MRPDKPKVQAPQKPGTKDQKKDLENRTQPKAASKPEPPADDNALAKIRHREQKGPTLH